METQFTKTAGIFAIISAFLSVLFVPAAWIAGFLEPYGSIDPNASGAVFAIAYFSFQIVSLFLPFILVALDRRHGGLGALAMAGIGFIILGIPGGVIVACFMCWGALRMIGTILFGSAMLLRHIAPRFPTLAFCGALILGGVIWVVLRAAEGTLLEWGGLFSDSWIANLIAISVSMLIFAFGLYGLGQWLRKAV